MVRAVLTNLVVLFIALPMDLWMRFWVLPRNKNREDRRIESINGMAHLWGAMTFHTVRIGLGLKVRVEGKIPESGRFLVLANHQSSVDVPAMLTYLRSLNLKFVAMEQLKYGKPAVSIALRNGGFAFVAKRSLGEDLALLREWARNLHRFDGSPAIFPEGIRTFDGSIAPFHLAGTETVRQICSLPVLPVTIDGLWKARTIWDFHKQVGALVTIRVSEPVPNEIVEKDPREAFRRVEETIRSNLRDIRGENGEEEAAPVAAGVSG